MLVGADHGGAGEGVEGEGDGDRGRAHVVAQPERVGVDRVHHEEVAMHLVARWRSRAGEVPGADVVAYVERPRWKIAASDPPACVIVTLISLSHDVSKLYVAVSVPCPLCRPVVLQVYVRATAPDRAAVKP